MPVLLIVWLVASELTSQGSLILLVEDTEDDVVLMKRALERAGLKNPVFNVKNGVEAIAYLAGEPPYWDRARYPIPAMVLLDIKMPLMDGFEVLKWIRNRPEFERLCVVMLTSSNEIRDVNRAYGLGATSFLVKHLDFWNGGELSKAVEKWLAR